MKPIRLDSIPASGMGGVTVTRVYFLSYPRHVRFLLLLAQKLETWCRRRAIETPAN